jgi:flagellar biosynthesis/type III secretory pathway chaperone
VTYSIQSQVDQVANAVSFLRNTLENNRIDDLTDALAKAQAALDQMNAYPGGVEQLRKDITALEQPLRQEIEDKLQKAGVDHQINGELIKLAMQKNAALQAFMAQQSDSATYSSSGSIPNLTGGVLSRKV